jgi:hypothetical protein
MKVMDRKVVGALELEHQHAISDVDSPVRRRPAEPPLRNRDVLR